MAYMTYTILLTFNVSCNLKVIKKVNKAPMGIFLVSYKIMILHYIKKKIYGSNNIHCKIMNLWLIVYQVGI